MSTKSERFGVFWAMTVRGVKSTALTKFNKLKLVDVAENHELIKTLALSTTRLGNW